LNITGNYIKLALQVKECFFGASLLIFRMNCLLQRGVWGSAVSSPSGSRGGDLEAKAFLGFIWHQILQKRLKLLFG